MDRTDATILRMLCWSPFHPVDADRGPMGIWDIARALGVHGNTVKRRLADMESAGILHGLSFFPNSMHMGIKVGFYALRFRDDAACDAAADAVFARGLPGATMRLSTPELRLNLPVRGDADPDAAAQALATELNADSWHVITYRYWDAEPLTHLEHRVLEELHKDLFARPPQIAAQLGVTPKTVRRCIAALRDKKAFCVVPLIDPMAISGLQALLLDIEIEDAEAARQVCRAFPELLANGGHGSGLMTFTALVETQGDLAAMLQEMRSIPGVRRVTPQVLQRMVWQALPPGLQRVSQRLVEVTARASHGVAARSPGRAARP